MKILGRQDSGSPPLPPKHLTFMSQDQKSFLSNGDTLLNWLKRDTHYHNHCSIVDIGCGYGRLAHAFLRDADFQGRYLGVDILDKQIQWCKDNLACDGAKKVSFQYLDVQNERYNKKGRLSTADVKVNIADHSADIVCFFSVFTHMYYDDIKNYLRLAGRLLTKGGEILGTFFLMNESWLQCERENKSRHPMPHVLNDFCSFHNAGDPLHAIAYKEDCITALFQELNFRVEKVSLGKWCGRRNAKNYQDLIVAAAL